jgi:hypothetical protein
MDRVGVEPTTSASFFFKDSAFYLSKVVVALERELYGSNPTRSILFLSTCFIGCILKRDLF